MKGRTDASTSTDELKDRPLCLFYFTHPFGVLSPEPPTVTTAPPNIARAFINMEPVSPFHFWSSPSDDSYNPATTTTADDSDPATTASSKLSYDLGNVTVHKEPLNLLTVARTRNCTVDFGPRRDSLSSSLFSSDIWFNSGSSSRSNEHSRRLIPYNRILPPLQLPSPKGTSTQDSSDDLWPRKCWNPEKFYLPPIEMPDVKVRIVRTKRSSVVEEVSSVESVSSAREVRGRRRRLGVRVTKPRRHLGDVRRLLACLMRRAVRGVRRVSPAPCLQEVLLTIREAWAEPVSLLDRCRRTVTRASYACVRVNTREQDNQLQEATASARAGGNMLTQVQLAEMSPQPGASPGLLRRRYSVPETIMRKYRLAQQRSDSDETEPPTDRSPASASPARGSCNSLCEAAHRHARRDRDREVMRKSALLRRMWGRPHAHPGHACCQCGAGGDCERPCRQPRSLDGSHCELRHSSNCFPSPRRSPPATASSPIGWGTPKRQRIGSPTDFRGSDDALRVPPTVASDRTEECSLERPPGESSESTYRSHGRIESVTDAFTDSDVSKLDDVSDANGFTRYFDGLSSDAATVEIKSEAPGETPAESDSFLLRVHSDERSYVDTSDTFPTSESTAKETNESGTLKLYDLAPTSGHIDGRVSERSVSVENEDTNVFPYDRPLTIDTPPCELLEIVVSETLNSNTLPSFIEDLPAKYSNRPLKARVPNHRNVRNINIDEYVSNILVESLNSLTDQLECMNASIGSDRKISIVEKEIKVKLQNTGVNTIVHLSPTSNNQIIFGNEELYNSDENKNSSNLLHEAVTIREELPSLESNNNVTSASPRDLAEQQYHSDTFDNIIQHDNVNQAVLQQIQKLFQDELHNLDSEIKYQDNVMPGISHIEISNVDVYIDNNSDGQHMSTDAIEMCTQRQADNAEVISSVGAGNYFQDEDETALVPRFSAFPHTDSMEVNTSSSDDAEILGSDCTSLVDSLDDPNSPRSVLLRRSFSNRRGELVRSAIDVLDLLPESAHRSQNTHYKDKGESFFIRIKDNNFDCEKENINVADHMPENIKQRLYKRQRKRELRMECARRSKVKQMKREMEKQRYADMCKSRRQVEKDCMAIINALIDDVIAKIAQDEYKYMRIKERPNRPMAVKSDENITKKTWRKDSHSISDRNPFKVTKNGTVQFTSQDRDKRSLREENHQIHGRLSLLTRPASTSDDRGPRRIYQKSEIHDGNKCIEILEILEYVNGSPSSPETANSDDSHENGSKSRKSRIPIPIHERSQRTLKNGRPVDDGDDESRTPTGPAHEHVTSEGASHPPAPSPARRASVPHLEPRSRSNSLRFRRVFDIIPEERSSLSVDSSNEDMAHPRRASAPDVGDECRMRAPGTPGEPTRRSAATSPPPPPPPPPATDSVPARRSATTMTSPGTKSAATSPAAVETRRRAWPTAAGTKVKSIDSDKIKERKSSMMQHERASVMRRILSNEAVDLKPARCRANKRRDGSNKTNRGEPRETMGTQPADEANRSVCDNRNEDVNMKKKFDEVKADHTFLEMGGKNSSGGAPVKLPEFKSNISSGGASSSDSGESGGSLLCSLAPKWLSSQRQKRTRRRDSAVETPNSPTPQPPPSLPSTDPKAPGGWSVTVAGSCRATLPADVEMRLRFPHEPAPTRDHATARAGTACNDANYQECRCRHCQDCACPCWSENAECGGCGAQGACGVRGACGACGRGVPLRGETLRGEARRGSLPPALHHRQRHLARSDTKLTLTMKKEASDSSILAYKSSKKSIEPLPDLESYRASRSKLKSSVKTRRGYSLHCWLPDEEPAMIRSNNGLSVLGSAIVPELKPRVPTMSERDLTRHYTPRHYLRL